MKRKRKSTRTRKQPTGDPNDPQGMIALMKQFFEWMQVKNFSEQTIETRQRHLGYFIDWAAARDITQPAEVTKPLVERYQRYMYHYRKRDGDPLSFQSQNNRLVPIRTWFRWLARKNYILYNPASDIELPKLERRLPKHVLTASEAEQVINQPNVNDPLGLRDRAILETFYSTGIRRSELIRLRPYDLDVERGTLVVRQGKGKKDRMIPIGERALAWIERYLVEVRPGLLVGDRTEVLFLTNLGEPITPNRMTDIVRKCVNAADIAKRGSCHLFRHTMATLMLENGADIRYIQAMLGHSRLETTEIYTHVSIRKLKEIHTATHPARLHRSP
jgi:integrase/recombinase XerD